MYNKKEVVKMDFKEVAKKNFTKPVLVSVCETVGMFAFSKSYCFGGESK